MIQFPHIRTERLDLIPATHDILISDQGDRTSLGGLLNAVIPAAWPPPLIDDDTLAEFIRMETDGSDPNFCTWYWVLDGQYQGDRILIGSGGTGSVPGVHDAVIIGYSVLDEFQNNGYATEAIRNLIPVIFSLPGVRRIIATTYPELKASIRVMEKNGFVPAGVTCRGTGMEEGTVMYIRHAPSPE
jgi:RimJ/RimL family protein N-acetyltransferase